MLWCFWPPGTDAFCQEVSIDSINIGTTKEYWVNSTAGSAYQWWIDGVLLEEQTDMISIFWQQLGIFKLEVRETTSGGCIGIPATIKVVVLDDIDKKVPFPFILPNAFTPNGDGLNDEFHPVMVSDIADIEGYSLMIFNKRGQLLFQSYDTGDGWNGTFNGIMSPYGAYMVQILYKPAGTSTQRKMFCRVMLVR